jgi:hypothetical protein
MRALVPREISPREIFPRELDPDPVEARWHGAVSAARTHREPPYG